MPWIENEDVVFAEAAEKLERKRVEDDMARHPQRYAPRKAAAPAKVPAKGDGEESAALMFAVGFSAASLL